MMRKLDQRGFAAFEFLIVAVAFFTLVYAIFDLGRYTITMQSLRALANAGARAAMVGIQGNACYTDAKINNTPLACSGDPLPSDAAKQAVAPFLYAGGLTPKLSMTTGVTTTGTTAVTVTASFDTSSGKPPFKMLMPIWGGALDNPSASTQVPF
jgi:Flp pilus assembly protein TadG